MKFQSYLIALFVSLTACSLSDVMAQSLASNFNSDFAEAAFDDAVPEDVQNLQRFPSGFDAPPAARLKQQEQLRQVQVLQQQIRTYKDEDKTKRDNLVTELKELMGTVFDTDYERRESSVAKLEARVGKLRAALDKRKQARDRIIQVRIDSLLLDSDGLAFPLLDDSRTPFPTMPYHIDRIEKHRDGSRSVYVALPERRTREVPYTTFVREQRTRTVNGVNQPYTVSIPQTRTRTEVYHVTGPSGSRSVFEVTVPKGADMDATIRGYISKSELKQRFLTQRNTPSDWKVGLEQTVSDFAPTAREKHLDPSDDLFDDSPNGDLFDDGESSDDLFDAPDNNAGLFDDDEPSDDLFR